ncbi:TetR/AcrR family transcriptional regulator [Euzebya rosea]|uniref:TetR/AcrR family transcriptional regulator n=1 Tax=Euzebya rosea TaxID=2052804 RepID=UPI000D3E7BDB|nr:TetR/AcrR family transcriptional regulator [Euzebya rosea]
MSADTLRERKKRETRTAIIVAALELCEQRGVEDVTVADIAEAANISRRTFFNYFGTREEAILGGSRQRSEAIAGLVAARPADEGPWEAVRRAYGQFLAEGGEPEREWLARARLVRSNPSLLPQQRADFARLEQALTEALVVRSGDAADPLRLRLLVAAAVSAVRVAFNAWLDGEVDGTLAAALDDALSTVGAGFDRMPTHSP